MKDSITTDRIANAIMQRRGIYENFILVEGSHDRLFFLKYKQEKTQVEISFGWEKLVEILGKLKARGYYSVVGVIDRDLREIIPEIYEFDDDIVFTDVHDINILCIEECFSTIFQSYCSEEKVDKFKKTEDQDIKAYIHSLIRPLSYLKILNKRHNLNLSFKSNSDVKNRLDYAKFIDKEKYELISIDKMIETIINFSVNKTKENILPRNEILKLLEHLIASETYESNVMNSGHDFGEIACLGLRKSLGSKEVGAELFLKECILAYDSMHFLTTKMYASIKEIEAKQGTVYLKM